MWSYSLVLRFGVSDFTKKVYGKNYGKFTVIPDLKKKSMTLQHSIYVNFHENAPI